MINDEIHERDLVEQFREAVLREYGSFIKSIVVVGSAVRKDFTPSSDIDIVIIVDDTSEDLAGKNRIEVNRRCNEIAKEISPRMSLQELQTLTEFTQYARLPNPVVYNFIREGKPIYDTGFFTPWKKLLSAGILPATREATDSLLKNAVERLVHARSMQLGIVVDDCYHAMVNAAQSALMLIGTAPPNPSDLHNHLKEVFVKHDLLEAPHAVRLGEIVSLRKQYEREQMQNKFDVRRFDAQVEFWIGIAEEFVARIGALIRTLITQRKEIAIKTSAEMLLGNAIANLRLFDKSPQDRNAVMGMFKKEFIDTGMIPGSFWSLWERIMQLHTLIQQGKHDEVSDFEAEGLLSAARTVILENQRSILQLVNTGQLDLSEGESEKKSKSRGSHNRR